MCSMNVNGLNCYQSYYNPYAPSFGGVTSPFSPCGCGCPTPYPMPMPFPVPEQKSEKIGFWEGLKAFGKGLINPIVNMIKHPVKSLLFMTAAAALIIGTGGAATPLLVGAGLAIGGYQMAKGAINFVASDTKQEGLDALENMGEGTFTVGASLFGAKSYAASTEAGSATVAAEGQAGWAKFATFTKGLGKDAWTTIKAVPGSAQETLAIMRSGEFTANLTGSAVTSKLSIQERQLAKMRAKGMEGTPEYQASYENYINAKAKFDASLATKQEAIFNKYADLAGKPKYTAIANQRGLNLIDNGFHMNDYSHLNSYLNIFQNAAEKNMILGLNNTVGDDPETMYLAQQIVPAYM